MHWPFRAELYLDQRLRLPTDLSTFGELDEPLGKSSGEAKATGEVEREVVAILRWVERDWAGLSLWDLHVVANVVTCSFTCTCSSVGRVVMDDGGWQ